MHCIDKAMAQCVDKLKWPVAATTGLIAITPSAAADWRINLVEGVTPISQDIYDLHMTIMGICALTGVVVYGFLIFIMIRYRYAKGAVPASFDSNRKVEWLWAIIPLLILIVMAVPSTIVLSDMEDFEEAAVTIKVTGSQWRWHYQYLDYGIGFYSNLSTPQDQLDGKAPKNPHYLLQVDERLVLPINQKVRFLVTSSDVIHSWWVPQLGVKRDAIPGFIHESWARIEKTGVFRGQCAELCGVHHAYMPIVVEAVSAGNFAQWVTKQQAQAEQKTQEMAMPNGEWTMQTAIKLGEAGYLEYCAACHQADGSGIPPLFPSLATSSVTVGEPIARHIDIVLQGRRGSAMQSYARVLDDREIAAIVTYERNAWDNHTGDLVTPEQVQARRLATKENEQ